MKSSLKDRRPSVWSWSLQTLTLPPLRHCGWHPKSIQPDKELWVRIISVNVKYCSCFPEWWNNSKKKKTLIKAKIIFVSAGILTKPDLVDKGMEETVVRTVNNQVIQLKKGYMIVKCRGQQDINDKLNLVQALEKEKQFFKGNSHFR